MFSQSSFCALFPFAVDHNADNDGLPWFLVYILSEEAFSDVSQLAPLT